MEELVLIENPYYRKRKTRRSKMKNPVSVSTLKNEWFAGLDLMDMGAAAGGLLASTMLPGIFVKETNTTLQKLGKILLALLSAAGAGFIFKSFAKNPSAGKAAVAGGVAGAVVQAIGLFTDINIGGVRRIGPGRRIDSAEVISPAMNREQETVQLITP